MIASIAWEERSYVVAGFSKLYLYYLIILFTYPNAMKITALIIDTTATGFPRESRCIANPDESKMSFRRN